MRTLRAVVVTMVAVFSLALLGGASPALATTPWWHINTVSAPSRANPGEGTMVLEVSNLGDTYANGLEHPITVTDKLPAGVTAEAIYPEGGGGSLAGSYAASLTSCSSAGQTVTCVSTTPVRSYERLMIAIRVKVAPGTGDGMNEIGVTGGGAPAALSRRALALGDATPSFGFENYELTPEEEGGAPDTQAGSHPFQLTSTFALKTTEVQTNKAGYGPRPEVEPSALTKDLRFNIPPGLVGNPTPLPQCSEAVFTRQVQGLGTCPNDTIVGVATVVVIDDGVLGKAHVPLVLSFALDNLVPSVGEPAKFGFALPAGIGPVILDTGVRTGSDYGVVVTVPDIPQYDGVIGSQVTFWGFPADARHDGARGECLQKWEFSQFEFLCHGQAKGQPFLIMPTSCAGSLQTSLEADSWEQAGQFTVPRQYSFQNSLGQPFVQDGCNRLNFEPSISVTPDSQQASTPTGLTVGVHVAQDASLNPKGLTESTVKDTTVTLPAGVGLNPAGADGLSSCGLGEIALESPAEQSCPESAKVGTVEISTPLLPNPLTGAAYLAAQNANPFGSLVALYIVARDPISGVLVKVAGQVVPDESTGQLVSTFKNTPQLPFEDLKLHFFGGSRAPLGTPALCGGYTTTASIAPWSGNAAVSSSSEFRITSGPNGSPCASPLPFNPSLTAGSLNIQAGAFTPFTMTMSREDGNQNLKAVQLKMPPGLLGTLASVKLCGEAEANAGMCGPESLIGETIVSVGLGGNPYSVRGGKVYITGGYHGAPYGLSIVNPAKAGPFDLGYVVVRAKIGVDPITAALTVTTDSLGQHAIPQMLDGIPLQIKHINVSINRPNFTFNPTNCTPTAITGTLTSSEGATDALSVPFQVTNCATLAFKPQFKVSTSGKTSRTQGASLDVKLTYPKTGWGTQANIKSVKVDVPRQLPSRLTTLQKACTASVFNADPAACPAASRIGEATATTPIIPVPLAGPAYFVSYGGEKFPELVIVLSGYGTTVQLHGETFISTSGITSSTFRTIPDVPVGSFELKLPEGPFSALGANVNLCKVKGGLKMPTAFVAQNGLKIKQTTKIAVRGCPKAKKAKRAHRRRKHKK